MAHFDLKAKLKSIFADKALTEKQQDELDKEIRQTAHYAGYKLIEQRPEDLSRIFHREFDDRTKIVPCKEELEARHRLILHEFDAYL